MSANCEKDFQISLAGLPRCNHPEDSLTTLRPAIKDYSALTFVKTCGHCAAGGGAVWDGIFRGSAPGFDYCKWVANSDGSVPPSYSVRGQSMNWIELINTGPWTIYIGCVQNNVTAFFPPELWMGSTASAAIDKNPLSDATSPFAVGEVYNLNAAGTGAPFDSCVPLGDQVTAEIVAVVPPP